MAEVAAEAVRPAGVVRFWLSEIEAAKKREKEFREQGDRVREIYAAKRRETTPFNILYSNTETLLPSLHSASPRPVVARRFKDDDPLGKIAAQAGQRCLEFLVDTNVDGYETFDDALKACVLDALLPGRGVACVKYDAELGEMAPEEGAPEGAPPAEPTPYTKSELVCLDLKPWNRVLYGFARKWSKVPWVAYEEHIDREEAERLFGREVAGKLTYRENEDRDREEETYNAESDDEKAQGRRKTACVWQIWDKDGGRKIRYVSEQYKQGYLKETEDPLQLTGFFNQPRPLQFVEMTADLVPVALYSLYENQAKELNKITLRIGRIVDAIKARGVYDSSLGDDIKNLLTADDNTFVPADRAATLSAERGLDNAIWFMPIETLVTTLTQLLAARNQAKNVIYEITGISDIVRGSTMASETATAQEIKTQWGTLRLKRLQKEVQRYARDLMRMMLEVAAARFSEETWAKMTGMGFPTTEAKARTMAIAQIAMQQGQQPDPKTAEALAKPSWGDILTMLRDDTQRAYRIDIETNSTVEPEAVEDKKNISELMIALGQFLNGVAPLVSAGVMPFQAAQSMMLAISRRFRFGTEIEGHIQAMQAPKPQEQDNSAEKASDAKAQDAEARAMQAEQKLKEIEAAARIKDRETKVQLDEIRLSSERTLFEMQKQAAEKALNQEAKAAKESIAGETRVKTAVEQSSKREQQVAKTADNRLRDAVEALQQTVGQLAQSVTQPVVQNQQLLAELAREISALAKAAGAPRKRTAIRGPDNRITHAIDEPVS